MVIGASRSQVVPILDKFIRKGSNIGDNLLLILLELWANDFFEGNRDACDRMLMRTSLQPWENCGIDSLLEIIGNLLSLLIFGRTDPIEDQSSSWPSQCFMSGCHDSVSILKGGGNEASCH